jgi:pimeloyl-ACP methyl ester carboxylesterase
VSRPSDERHDEGDDMSTIETSTPARSGLIRAGDTELWFDQRGEGPDVFLIAGLTDPAEAWEFQLQGLADRYRVTAFDNRGAGRSPMIPEGFTVAGFADDAAALMQALGIESAHIAGFSGGSATAQELALRHPELVRSLVLQSTWAAASPHFLAATRAWQWLVESAPDARAMLEAFFLWVYTPRAFNDGTVAQIIDDALAFPFPQSDEGFMRQLATWTAHDTADRLHQIAVPTLVLAGSIDAITVPELGRDVADRIPGAAFRILEGEAHQPFQEQVVLWNEIVDQFWAGVERT